MSRLPIVGQDAGNWGNVLNDYLSVSHKGDGTHKLGLDLLTETVDTVEDSGSTLTLSALTTATIHYVTLTDDCVLTFPTPTSGQSFLLALKQDENGNRSVTWPENVMWPSGETPTITNSVGAVDLLTFICIDGINWYGFVSGQDIK